MDVKQRAAGETEFRIMAYDRTTGKEEEIDIVDGDSREAERLRNEYTMAYGANWSIRVERS